MTLFDESSPANLVLRQFHDGPAAGLTYMLPDDMKRVVFWDYMLDGAAPVTWVYDWQDGPALPGFFHNEVLSRLGHVHA